MRFPLVQGAQKRPHRERDHGGQHHVRNQNAGEQEQARTCGYHHAGQGSGAAAERPAAERRGDPAEQHRGERHRNPRYPIVRAEELETATDQPVNERRFFQVGDAVQPRRHPVARPQHVAGNLRLHGVHIVHQRGRRNHGAAIDRGSRQ